MYTPSTNKSILACLLGNKKYAVMLSKLSFFLWVGCGCVCWFILQSTAACLVYDRIKHLLYKLPISCPMNIELYVARRAIMTANRSRT